LRWEGVYLCPVRLRPVTLLPPASCSTQHPSKTQGRRKAVYATLVPLGFPKECLIEIRNVQRHWCQDAGALNRVPRRPSFLYLALTNRLLNPYRKWRPLDEERPPASAREANPPSASEGGRRDFSMTIEFQEQTLWLLPLGLAVSFMLWVLWHFFKETRRQSGSNLPAIQAPNSAVRDGRNSGKAALHLQGRSARSSHLPHSADNESGPLSGQGYPLGRSRHAPIAH
jgi:hypothetical protein